MQASIWQTVVRRKAGSTKTRVGVAIFAVALAVALAVTALPGHGWAPAPGAGASPDVYVVESGDTVAQIAEKYGTSVASIALLNRLDTPDVIYVGQELKVAEATGPGTAPAESEDAAAEQTHVVVAGDTLWGLAVEYGVNFEALLERNDLTDFDWISPGQEIIIPPPDARPTGATRGGVREDPGGRIWVPYRTQLDGSPTAGSNCGPATLGMAMSYFGEWWLTEGIRRDVNEFQGTYSLDAGSSWEALAYAARKRGFEVVGAVDPSGDYHQWTVDDLVAQTKAGRPVILLTRYWSLPGHGDAEWWGDHYILFVGLTASGDVVYHDPAFPGESEGAYRIMSQDRLIRAWTRTATGLQYTAMALEWLGDGGEQ